MSVVAVLSALVPVFLLIVAGVITRRLLVTDDAHWIGVERLIYYLLYPPCSSARWPAPIFRACRSSKSAAFYLQPC
jgi:hypothetical protein